MRVFALVLAAALGSPASLALAQDAAEPGQTGAARPGLAFHSPWRAGPALSHARAGLAAAALDGKIYAAGGAGLVDPRDDFEVYDPATGRWSPRPALPEGLERFAMAEVAGRLYVAGGYSADSGAEPVAAVWSYDPGANLWRSEPEMPGAKASFSMLAHDGRLYAFGGEDGAPGLFVHDPETLEWSALPAPPAIDRRGAAALAVDGAFWLIGGARGGQATARVDIYDPEAREWRVGPDLPEARAGHAAAVLDGAIHVFGGRSADMRRTVQAHWVLEPGSDRWADAPPMPGPRTEAAAATLDGEVWLIGGGAGAGFFAPFTAVDTVDVLQAPAGD